jgi:hypothetical protein
MSSFVGFEVGSRIKDADGHRATVRYVGPVAAAKKKDEVWLGVEWDSQTREKHDGSFVGQVGQEQIPVLTLTHPRHLLETLDELARSSACRPSATLSVRQQPAVISRVILFSASMTGRFHRFSRHRADLLPGFKKQKYKCTLRLSIYLIKAGDEVRAHRYKRISRQGLYTILIPDCYLPPSRALARASKLSSSPRLVQLKEK